MENDNNETLRPALEEEEEKKKTGLKMIFKCNLIFNEAALKFYGVCYSDMF